MLPVSMYTAYFYICYLLMYILPFLHIFLFSIYTVLSVLFFFFTVPVILHSASCHPLSHS